MIAGLVARVRSLWRGIGRTHDVDAEMRAEFEHHIQLRAADLVREGVPLADAERRARVEFGGTYGHQQEGRGARGLRAFDALRFSLLDFKLGARMLLKYPGLTLVSSAAMGVAIAIGAAVMGAIALMKDPHIPLDEGDRIVGIQVWNVVTNGAERRIITDFATWKKELRSVQDLGAFRDVSRNLVLPDGRIGPMRAAEMTASGFRVARVAPLKGRYLLDADERRGAPDVVVISHDLWRNLFGMDSAIVGRVLNFGGAPHTVVGVMPPAFHFPVSHNMWVAFRADPLSYKRREGPTIYVFGRLAPDATLDGARAEIAALSANMATEFPDTHRRLTARLLPYAQSWFELDSPDQVLAMRSAQLAVTLLLLVICAHIAILVYARTATRQGEIAVRSALGASRPRIVAQLFGEALVLSASGAAVGYAMLTALLMLLKPVLTGQFPFWVRIEVSNATLGYIVLLGVLGAVVIGVIPGLQITGRRVQLALQRLSGGHSSVRLGRTWTALIVAEVAFSVAILPASVFFASEAVRNLLVGPGFAAEQYLIAELSIDRELVSGRALAEYERGVRARFARDRDALLKLVAADPNVASATYAFARPYSQYYTRFEVDSATSPGVVPPGMQAQSGWTMNRVRLEQVGPNFFETFDVPLVVGRRFGPADADSTSRTAIVNRALVATAFQGRNAVGARVRQLRYVPLDERSPDSTAIEFRAGPWLQIVGVVDDFPARKTEIDTPVEALYRPLDPGMYPMSLLIRMRTGGAATYAGRLRAKVTTMQSALQVRTIRTLDAEIREHNLPMQMVAVGLVIVTLSVLVLSAAGIYALMSVVVTRRRREIGIRMALGADRRQVLTGVFSRAALQLGTGVVIGSVVSTGMGIYLAGDGIGLLGGGWILPTVALIMMGVGTLATLGPARRGLAIQPSTVLKEE